MPPGLFMVLREPKFHERLPMKKNGGALTIHLDDRQENTNGYVRVSWNTSGAHDRARKGRPVFGKIRCMSLGLKNIFPVDDYIKKLSAPRP